MFTRKYILLLLLIFVAITAAACGGDDDDSNDSGDPAAAAKEYLEAGIALDVDRVRELTCAAELDTINADDVPEEDVSFDFSGVEFTAEINGDEAIVTGSGPVSLTFGDQTQEGNFEDLGLGELRMVREDGQWKACNASAEDGAVTPEPDDILATEEADG